MVYKLYIGSRIDCGEYGEALGGGRGEGGEEEREGNHDKRCWTGEPFLNTKGGAMVITPHLGQVN